MDKFKLYQKSNKECVICKKPISIKELVENQIEISVTRRKTIIVCHKKCIKSKK